MDFVGGDADATVRRHLAVGRRWHGRHRTIVGGTPTLRIARVGGLGFGIIPTDKAVAVQTKPTSVGYSPRRRASFAQGATLVAIVVIVSATPTLR
ncbi:MAG: hypothetical protein RMJ83_10205 [Armatimonadota bacterium]|nr:hypothetical protein [Armatimonadota bacterium]